MSESIPAWQPLISTLFMKGNSCEKSSRRNPPRSASMGPASVLFSGPRNRKNHHVLGPGRRTRFCAHSLHRGSSGWSVCTSGPEPGRKTPRRSTGGDISADRSRGVDRGAGSRDAHRLRAAINAAPVSAHGLRALMLPPAREWWAPRFAQ